MGRGIWDLRRGITDLCSGQQFCKKGRKSVLRCEHGEFYNSFVQEACQSSTTAKDMMPLPVDRMCVLILGVS